MLRPTRPVVTAVCAVVALVLLLAGCRGATTGTTDPPTATAPTGVSTAAVVDDRPVGVAPLDVVGDVTRIRVGGFAAGSVVTVQVRPSDWTPEGLVADAAGVVALDVPRSELRPGVTSLVFGGATATGTAIAREVLLRTPGAPSAGSYMTYLCCLDGGEGTEVEVTWLGERLATARADAAGGVLVEVPILELPDDVERTVVVEDTESGQVLREVVD